MRRRPRLYCFPPDHQDGGQEAAAPAQQPVPQEGRLAPEADPASDQPAAEQPVHHRPVKTQHQGLIFKFNTALASTPTASIN